MAAVTAPLTKDMVPHPQMWRMAMLVAPEGIDVTVMSVVEDNTLIYKHITLPDDPGSRLRAIEDAVYENPLLLSDFGKTDILISTRRYMVMPAEIAETEARDRVLAQFWPDISTCAVFTDTGLVLPGNLDAIVFVLGSDEASFLQRTFPTARISHAITPMVRYFARSSRLGCSGKMYVCLRRDEIDMIAYTTGGLLMAVTKSVSTTDDALYYIMAALQSSKLNPAEVEIMLCGDNDMRQQLTPLLRRFAGYVMPVVFPSEMFRAGKDAMIAPFALMLVK